VQTFEMDPITQIYSINDVDFTSQFILVAQIGIRNTATGYMNIAEIEYDDMKENVVVYIRVGVNE
jgi:hypothetical protein